MTYGLHLLNLVLVFGLSAVGLSFCVGHVGQLSMAQAAAFGVGAYAYSILGVGYALPSWAALAGSGLVAIVFALAAGFIGRILAGDEFVFGTLAFNVMVAGLLANATDGTSPLGTLKNLTNGPFGIAGVPPLPSRALGAQPWLLGAAVALAVAILLAASHAALASPWGRLLRAVRDSPSLALSLGKRVCTERARAAQASSFLASMAGALYAAAVRYVDPGVASTNLSVFFLTCLVIGGSASFWGPLLGTAGVVLLPEALRFFGAGGATVASLRVIGYAAVLLLLLHLRPAGLLGRGAGPEREAGA